MQKQTPPPLPIRKTMNGSSSSSEPPSPSPIPTGKGSRCADPVFVEHLNRSVKIPKLSLPESVHRSVPAEIDRRLLVSRESDSTNRFLLRSVVEFGVFLISGHGICVEELRSSFTEADVVFLMSDDREMGYCRHYGGCEEFVWRHYEAPVAETARKAMGADKYSTFREGIENVAKELEAIATELGQIIWESETNANNNKQLISRLQGIEKQRESAVVSLYRYDHDDALKGLSDSPIPCFKQHDDDDALRLHLPLDHCEFHAQSARGLLSFNATPQTIVVTIGKHFQGRSLGKFKPSFSLQLKYPLASTLNEDDDGNNIITKTITVADQILFVIIIAFLYKVFVFMFC